MTTTTLNADTGSFSVTGVTATTTYSRGSAAVVAGSFGLVGSPATLTVIRGKTIVNVVAVMDDTALVTVLVNDGPAS